MAQAVYHDHFDKARFRRLFGDSFMVKVAKRNGTLRPQIFLPVKN
jgi:hypothetical protein